jgi:endonuclease III related protein
VTPAGKKRAVYAERFTKVRLTPDQQFEMAVGAILTQNTSWTNVAKALDRLSDIGRLTPGKIAALPLPRLQELIRSSGYFRQKSVRLRGFSRFLLENWQGRIDRFLDRPTALVREELLALNGVGPETADSILLYAGGHPVFVVDAYTRRMGQRFGLFRTADYHEVQEYVTRRFPASLYEYREYHALIVALGKDFCRTAPLCSSCPLASRCPTARKIRK